MDIKDKLRLPKVIEIDAKASRITLGGAGPIPEAFNMNCYPFGPIAGCAGVTFYG